MPNLYFYPKEGDPFEFLLTTKKISIGRSSKNDIPLLDPFCSGIHALDDMTLVIVKRVS